MSAAFDHDLLAGAHGAWVAPRLRQVENARDGAAKGRAAVGRVGALAQRRRRADVAWPSGPGRDACLEAVKSWRRNNVPRVGVAYRITKVVNKADQPLVGGVVTIEEVARASRTGFWRIVGKTHGGSTVVIDLGAQLEPAPVIRHEVKRGK